MVRTPRGLGNPLTTAVTTKFKHSKKTGRLYIVVVAKGYTKLKVPYDYALTHEGNHTSAAKHFCAVHNLVNGVAKFMLKSTEITPLYHYHALPLPALYPWQVAMIEHITRRFNIAI